MNTFKLIAACMALCLLSFQAVAQDEPEKPAAPAGDWVEITLDDGTPFGFGSLLQAGDGLWGADCDRTSYGWLLHNLHDGKSEPVKLKGGELFRADLNRFWRVAGHAFVASAVDPKNPKASPGLYLLEGAVATSIKTPDDDLFMAEPQAEALLTDSNYLGLSSREGHACYRYDGKLTRVKFPVDNPRFRAFLADGDRLFCSWPLGVWMYDGKKWTELKDEDGDPLWGPRRFSQVAGDYLCEPSDESIGTLYVLQGDVLRRVTFNDDLYARDLCAFGDRVLVTITKLGVPQVVAMVEFTKKGAVTFKPYAEVAQRQTVRIWGDGNVGMLIAYDGRNYSYYRLNADGIAPFKFAEDQPLGWIGNAVTLKDRLVATMRSGGWNTPWQLVSIDKDGNVGAARDKQGNPVSGSELRLGQDSSGIYVTSTKGETPHTWYLPVK